MRISDWSSDVCLSDLDAERRGYVDVEHCFELFVGLLLDHAVAGVAGVVDDDVEPAEAIERASDEAFAEIGGGDVADTGDGFAPGRLDRRHGFQRRRFVEKIGRASCRERVCQYV